MLQRALASRRWHAVLRGRGILAIEGADSRKLLQGLTTASVDELEGGKPLYTTFLNAQGRVLAAGFLLPAREGGVVVDVDAGVAGLLAEHLKRYKLRSKVSITDRSEEFVVGVSGGPDSLAAPLSAEGAHAGDGSAWRDPRLSCLGWRMLLPCGSDGVTSQALAAESTEAPPELHALCEALLGVRDDPRSVPPAEALPLESNFELLGGVDFEKGCYLGQELTARTHWRGVTRKRLLPVVCVDVAERLAAVRASDCPAGLSHLPETERALAAVLPLDSVWASAGWLEPSVPAEAALPAETGAAGAAGAAKAKQNCLGEAEGGEAGAGSLSGASGASAGKLRAYASTLGLGVALCRLSALSGGGGALTAGVLTTPEGLRLVPLRPSWWPASVGAPSPD